MTRDEANQIPLRVTVARPAALMRSVAIGLSIPIAGPLVLAAVGKAIDSSGGPPSWFGVATTLFLLLGVLVGAFGAARSKEKSVALEIDREALRIGERRILRSVIESGILVQGARLDRVELQLAGGEPLVLELEPGAGSRVLDELGLGTSRRRARVPLTTPAEQALIGFGGGVLALVALVMLFGAVTAVTPEELLSSILASPAFSPLAAGLAALVALAGGLTFARSVPDVVIGVDGVSHAKPGLGRRGYAFTSFADVERVDVEEFGTGRARALRVLLVHQDGERTVVATLHAAKRDQIDAIAHRIRASLVEFRAAEGRAATALEKANAPVSTWLEGLRELARRGSDYRSGALAPDQLAEIVADPKAPLDVRVGAAVVLAEGGDDDARSRVRVAADAAASPRLRIALESVASGAPNEDAVEAALQSEEEDASRAEAEAPARAG